MTEAKKSPVADAPRALSLNLFQFNFKVGVDAHVMGRYGAPAFAERRMRLDRQTEAFWTRLERRHQELWIAACEGRIAEDGRERRQALLTSDGRDPLGAREHRFDLYRVDREVEDAAVAPFNQAWARHLNHCGLDELQTEYDAFVRYFPIEARLATDPETGRFLWRGRAWQPPKAPTRAEVLARFPLR
jgi:hypothetical protein